MTELRACPFCGCKNIATSSDGEEHTCYCLDCGTENTTVYDIKSARSFWNTRPLEDAQAAEIERLRAALKEASNLIADEDANDQFKLEFAGHIDALLKGGE